MSVIVTLYLIQKLKSTRDFKIPIGHSAPGLGCLRAPRGPLLSPLDIPLDIRLQSSGLLLGELEIGVMRHISHHGVQPADGIVRAEVATEGVGELVHVGEDGVGHILFLSHVHSQSIGHPEIQVNKVF